MKRDVCITFITALVLVVLVTVLRLPSHQSAHAVQTITVGFVYDSDESTPYTNNFIRAQHAVEQAFGAQVHVLVRSNVPPDRTEAVLAELAESGCALIFTTSYGYQNSAKRMAQKYPNVQFCQATGDNAGHMPMCANYHTFMGEIYQGRYVAGIVAGMKLAELLADGTITAQDARIGYVAAHPVAEVISGYTAFLLGVRSIVPTATMSVLYTHTWSSYSLEKAAAKRLIDQGCVIISQHSDTIGPAVACEEQDSARPVFHVGYNQSMIDVAPTSSLVSTRINWIPYVTGAVKAVCTHTSIEKVVRGRVHGNDIGAGFDQNYCIDKTAYHPRKPLAKQQTPPCFTTKNNTFCPLQPFIVHQI